MQRRRNNANNSLQAQVNRLTQMVQSMTVQPVNQRRGRSRSRRRSRARTPGPIVQAPAATSMVMARGPGRSRSRQRLNLAGTGTIRFSNRELFATMEIPQGKSPYGGTLLVDAKSGSGFLSKLSALFGRYRWVNISFEYESMVSSATDGVIAYGLDWGVGAVTPAKEGTTLSKVTSLNPSVSHPLWESNVKLPPVPNSRLNARLWYDVSAAQSENSALATLWFYLSSNTSDAKTFGAIWVSYTVELQGPIIS